MRSGLIAKPQFTENAVLWLSEIPFQYLILQISQKAGRRLLTAHLAFLVEVLMLPQNRLPGFNSTAIPLNYCMSLSSEGNFLLRE